MLNLQQPQVQALAWSIFGPRLLNMPEAAAPEIKLTDMRINWLRGLDAYPAPLINFMDKYCSSTRLGLQFESYWHFFLQQDSRFTLLAHNLPVRDDGKTLGEFDVIFREEATGTTFHLELAVKFYLQVIPPDTNVDSLPTENQSESSPPTVKPLSQWLGPNCRDRLDLKIDRLREHQLKLSTDPSGQAALEQIGVQSVTPAAIIKGYVFYAEDDGAALDSNLAVEHERGCWQPLSAFNSEWSMLEKPDWFTAQDLKPLPHAIEKPIMLIHTSGQRGFATPDIWPTSAAEI